MEISFSDRLSNIVALTNALATDGNDPAEAQVEARRIEEEARAAAGTVEVYENTVQSLLLAKQSLASNGVDSLAVDPEDAEILNYEGPQIGNYEYTTFHRDGQMSTIFKARAKDRLASPSLVALKVTTPGGMDPPHNSIREGRLLQAAQHPCVVQLLETFQQPGGRLVMVFPFLRQDLENLLRSGVLVNQQKTIIFKALFSALSHIHQLGMIHRDIKPSNILLKTMEGPVYLADFGIAWSPNDPDSEPAGLKITDVGTTSYRPPELLFGCTTYDASLDMWAAGCVIAELVRANHDPLFDAGPLGSELALIKSMFSALGTPNEETWPSARTYPDWGKMRFQDFPAKPWTVILPGASRSAIDFVRQSVCYESTQRMRAVQVRLILQTWDHH